MRSVWKENVRLEDGTILRERRTEPGGHTKSIAYTKAEKVHRNLERSSGYHGAPPRPKDEPKAPPLAKTLRQVSELWLAQHPSRATKPGTVEGYESLLRNNIWPALTYTETRGRRKITRTIELGDGLPRVVQISGRSNGNSWSAMIYSPTLCVYADVQTSIWGRYSTACV